MLYNLYDINELFLSSRRDKKRRYQKYIVTVPTGCNRMIHIDGLNNIVQSICDLKLICFCYFRERQDSLSQNSRAQLGTAVIRRFTFDLIFVILCHFYRTLIRIFEFVWFSNQVYTKTTKLLFKIAKPMAATILNTVKDIYQDSLLPT